MHKINQYIADQKHERASAECKVFKLSNAIQSLLGWRTIPASFTFYPMEKFVLVKTKRLFNTGWIDLLEINPLGHIREMGYTGAENAHWIKPQGTSTINLPPDEVVVTFFAELQKHVEPIPEK